MYDDANAIFSNRCQQMGYVVCRVKDKTVRPANETAPESSHRTIALVSKHISALQASDTAVRIDDQHEGLWLADALDSGSGCVVLRSLCSGLQLTPSLQSMAGLLKAMRSDLEEADQQREALDDLTEQLGQCYENITMLYDIGRSMHTIDAHKIIVQGICEQIRMTQSYGWSAICLLETERAISGIDQPCVIAGDMPCDLSMFSDQASLLLERWDDRSWSRLLQPEDHPLAELVRSEVILHPIRRDGLVVGVVLVGGKTGVEAEATSGDTQLLDAVAGFLGAMHENTARLAEQKTMFIGSLEAVSAALDAKDRYTHGHSQRVAWLGSQLAAAIGLNASQVERIRISGLVHDVGKIGVPEAVLCKTGRLTDDEFEQIKKHPRVGYNILKGIPKMQDVLDGVLFHHERWDGRGYPEQRAGLDIPLYGRILAVADTFDAMSSTRSYRKAMPRQKVLEEILACGGSQFDPDLVQPFVEINFGEYDRMVAEHQSADEQAIPERSDRAA